MDEIKIVYVVTWCHYDKSQYGTLGAFLDEAAAKRLIEALKDIAGVDYRITPTHFFP